jgi:CRP-like cAMP-binding protein
MLATILNKVGRFSTSDIAEVEKVAVQRRFKKNEMLLTAGEVCRSAFFLISGTAYQFALNDIEENIIDLYTEGDSIINYVSFTGQKPSANNIRAYTDCEVFELTIHEVHRLIELSPVFFQLGKIMEQALSRMHYFDNALTPLQKYNHLLDTKSHLLQHFPLKMIASYLKMTPETLSRVRGIY